MKLMMMMMMMMMMMKMKMMMMMMMRRTSAFVHGRKNVSDDVAELMTSVALSQRCQI